MIIEFRSFTITINTNNSITIATNFNAPSGPNNNNYKIVFDNNSYMYLTTSKGSQTQTISSGNVYDYIYRQIGNETSKRFTAYIIYNTSKSNSLQAKATIPEYSLSMSASSTDTNNGGQTTNYDTQSIHYVNEFISGTTYLQGWSKPRIDYLISSSTGALYGNKLTLTGAITGTADLGTTSLQLGTDFAAGTYSVEAGDGRKTTTTSHTINRISWKQPSISINISRYSSVGRRIDWNLEGIWSYISNALQPNVNLQLTYNNITYTLYTKNDEFYWYDGTRLYKDTTGAEIGSFDISTYSLGVPIDYPTLSQVSNVTANGQFILVDEDDYKYSISATAYLTDNIDYRVYANGLIPSGLPAIYCYKDSNSNNAVDIYGDTNIDGDLYLQNNKTISYISNSGGLIIGANNGNIIFRPYGVDDSTKQIYINSNGSLNITGGDISVDGRINLGANGLKTLSPAGYTTDRYGNFRHQQATASDEWQLYDYNGYAKARFIWESGKMYLNNRQVATNSYIVASINNGVSINAEYKSIDFDASYYGGNASDFTLSNGKIYIGNDVSKIRVSATIFCEGVQSSWLGYAWFFLRKNGTDFANYIVSGVPQYFQSASFSPKIIDVSSGDYIELLANNSSYTIGSYSIRAGYNQTWIMIERVE